MVRRARQPRALRPEKDDAHLQYIMASAKHPVEVVDSTVMRLADRPRTARAALQGTASTMVEDGAGEPRGTNPMVPGDARNFRKNVNGARPTRSST